MNPYLRKGENYTALDKGTDVLMALAKGEYNSDQYAKKRSSGNFPKGIIIPIIIIIFFIIMRSSRGGGSSGRNEHGKVGFFLGSMLGGRRWFWRRLGWEVLPADSAVLVAVVLSGGGSGGSW